MTAHYPSALFGSPGARLLCVRHFLDVAPRAIETLSHGDDIVLPCVATLGESLDRVIRWASHPGVVTMLFRDPESRMEGLRDLKRSIDGGDYALALHLARVLTRPQAFQFDTMTWYLQKALSTRARVTPGASQIAQVASLVQDGLMPTNVIRELMLSRFHILSDEMLATIEAGLGAQWAGVKLFSGESVTVDEYGRPGVVPIAELGLFVHAFSQIIPSIAGWRFMKANDAPAEILDKMRAKHASFFDYLESHPLNQLAFAIYYGIDRFREVFDKMFDASSPLAPRRARWEWIFTSPVFVFAEEAPMAST